MPSHTVPDYSSDSSDNNNNHPPRARRTNIRPHKLFNDSTFAIPTTPSEPSENEHSQDRKGTTTTTTTTTTPQSRSRSRSRPKRQRLHSFDSMSTILDSEEETSLLRTPIARLRLEDKNLDCAELAQRETGFYEVGGDDEAFVWVVKAFVALVCLGIVGTIGYLSGRAAWEGTAV